MSKHSLDIGDLTVFLSLLMWKVHGNRARHVRVLKAWKEGLAVLHYEKERSLHKAEAWIKIHSWLNGLHQVRHWNFPFRDYHWTFTLEISVLVILLLQISLSDSDSPSTATQPNASNMLQQVCLTSHWQFFFSQEKSCQLDWEKRQFHQILLETYSPSNCLT
jgi:hypothetical protein